MLEIENTDLQGQELEAERRLRNHGLISFAGGVQIDLNTVPQKRGTETFDAHRCDHNCLLKDGSGYDCPASFTRNHNLGSNFPSHEALSRAILSASEGVRIGNELLIQSGSFQDYCDYFRVPGNVSDAILQVLNSEKIQVNLFGGNPEMYKDLLNLVNNCTLLDQNLTFNLTTTGRRSIITNGWIEQVAQSEISSASLSCDNIDVELLRETSNLDDNELKLLWRKVLKDNPLNGSAQKAIEAIFTARQVSKASEDQQVFPLTFNLVIHPGNLRQIEELVGELAHQFPNSNINPFPAQSSMEDTGAIFNANHLSDLEEIINWAIDVHSGETNDFPLTPRLHYWLMLKSVFETNRGNPDTISMAMSGYNVWDCYSNLGAARYIQIGASTKPWPADKTESGGHLSCYWNPTVTMDSHQVWDASLLEVASYISGGITKIANANKNPCKGCIMPRLTFDMYSQEVGMDRAIIPSYLELRKTYVGF